MKLFGKTKMEKLETDIAALRKRAAQLADQKVSAQAALDTAVSARRARLLDGDLGDEKLAAKLQASVDSAQSALHGIIDAISAQESRIAAADQALDAEGERVKREAASEEVARNVDAVERLLPGWLAQSRAIADAFRKLDHLWEAGQLSGFFSGCAGEAEVAAAVTLGQLRDLPKLIVSGDRPIPRKPEPAPPPVPAKPPVVMVFATQKLRWIDDAGKSRVSPRYVDVELPLRCARRARELRACVELNDPVRKRHYRGAVGGADPDSSNAIDLDAEPERKAEPIMQSSPFVVVDRGPPKIVQIATRSLT
jgi:hypothetical protein